MPTIKISKFPSQNINELLPVETQLDKAPTKGKSLVAFTRKEIEVHVRETKAKTESKIYVKNFSKGKVF